MISRMSVYERDEVIYYLTNTNSTFGGFFEKIKQKRIIPNIPPNDTSC